MFFVKEEWKEINLPWDNCQEWWGESHSQFYTQKNCPLNGVSQEMISKKTIPRL
jgi:hypothetical protein